MRTTRRTFMGAASAALGGAFLAACSQDVPQVDTPTSSATAVPVLDSQRLATVLARIQKGLEAADSAKSSDDLVGYLTGPAARIRGESYTLATASSNDSVIDPLTTTSQAEAVGLTTSFPRTALTVTEGTDTSNVPYLLALTEETARDPYEMWGWAQLFNGVEVPSTATPSVGSAQVGADTTGLIATPEETLAAYVDALNDPSDANGTAFADDALRQRVAAERSPDVSTAGEITVTASAGSDGFRGLLTTDGGAIVMTTLGFDTTYKLTVAGAGMTVSAQIASLLSGDAAVRGTVTATYDIMIAFSIPPKGGDAAVSTVLGATLVLAGATRDDSQAPA